MTRLSALLQVVRPTHWPKNLACLAGVIFGGRLMQPDALVLGVLLVGVFILASAATYVLNDLCDVTYDRQHPTKRSRPLAAGTVSPLAAGSLAAVLALAALGSAAWLGSATLACVAAYLVINVLYSLHLKHIVLLDVTTIATGWVLRVVAGIYVLGDVPTAWIVLCTYFLAMFLAIAKRHAEFVDAEQAGESQRPVMAGYRLGLLENLLDSGATMTIVSYALFTATSGKNSSLIVTVPLVYYGTMHYRRLVMLGLAGAEPEQVLLRDNTIRITIVLWLVCFVGVFYGDVTLFR